MGGRGGVGGQSCVRGAHRGRGRGRGRMADVGPQGSRGSPNKVSLTHFSDIPFPHNSEGEACLRLPPPHFLYHCPYAYTLPLNAYKACVQSSNNRNTCGDRMGEMSCYSMNHD